MVDANSLSDICNRINLAGPELSDLGSGAFAFTLIAKALEEDYAAFIESLRPLDGGKSGPDQAAFRASALAEVAKLTSTVQRALHQEAHRLSEGVDRRILDVPTITLEELPESGMSELEDRLVPIHIPGGVADTPAARKWTPEYFRDRYGSLEVPTNIFTGQREPLGQFVQKVLDSRGKEGGFMTTCEEVFDAYPELVEDLQIPKLASRLKMDTGHPNFSNHLFMGGQMGFCSWHAAGDTNFYYMVYGKKDWYLAHPKHAAWFYPYMCSGKMRGHFTISPVDPEASIKREADPPLPNGVPIYRARLEPGDLLLIPPWWLHTVGNMTEFAIAVASRLTTPVLRNPEMGSLLLTTVERVFPGGAHLTDLANWKHLPSNVGALRNE